MTFENRFGLMERLLHYFSFHSRFSQLMLADLEDTIYESRLASVAIERPVFVTGLPRSGTTLLLSLLVESGHFASHTYRDMPFVLCPLLWSKFSRRFAVHSRPRERAHGDGIEIMGESPEAFEEILWKKFWPNHYHSDHIDLWTSSDINEAFDEFFRRHLAKIILIRGEESRQDLRYVSKNNANIARLGVPSLPLRDGIVLVPFRDPYQHSASMLRQHRRFTRLQAADRFTRRYMEEIGHHDFGLGLKPIDFGGWITDSGDPNRLEFWVRYWCAAYQTVLSRLDVNIHLLDYDRLTSNARRALRKLASVVNVPAEDLASLVHRIRQPRLHAISREEVERTIGATADEIHRELVRISRVY